MGNPSAVVVRPLLPGRLVVAAAGLLALQLATGLLALENGLARTPPMGWLAWERFTCELNCDLYPNECINSDLFEQMSARMAAGGWLKLGYDHVNIDDCWSEKQRNQATGRLVPDQQRFKRGIKHLADIVHSYQGLKLGIYGDCGTLTCAGYPGQLKVNNTQEEDDYRTATWFKVDADTLAEWQVDSLKFDGCYVDPIKAERICSPMAKALAETGRPIMLVCEWPFYMMYAHAEPDFELAAASCNVWRYYDDIEDSWLSVLNTIDYTIKHQSTMLKYHGPGHWFDPDQLVIGNFGLSVGQARAQMALWCVWSAPLYMSNDLRNIRPEFVRILQNEHLIAMDQDKLGVFGLMVKQTEDGLMQAWVKPILPVRNKCPSFAIVVLNRATLGNKRKVSFKLADLLLGAPIKQAAINQARVIKYERRTGGPKASPAKRDATKMTTTTTRSHDFQQRVLTGGQKSADDELLEAALGADMDEAMKEPEPHNAVEAEQKEEEEHQDQQQDQHQDVIDPFECVKRLTKAARSDHQGPESDDEGPKQHGGDEVKFMVFDLFADGNSIGSFSLRDSLELMVEPSSVRALRLVEK
uniref:Alpha-galactosidase n=1 Tax=Aceria tosichella TaxID=561515 RepID=A0A6G1S877_9ACAR